MHKIEEKIEEIQGDTQEADPMEIATEIVTLFDGMAVVNSIKLGPAIQNCQQFAEAFLKIILGQAADASEIRIVFDRYLENSLQGSTREKRTKDVPIQFEVQSDTSLAKLNLKKFLSHIKTKHKLTIFLGRYLATALQNTGKKFAVSYDTVTVSNITGIEPKLNGNTHEEADTLLTLHALDVTRQNPFRQLHVFSPDTDVFLLLIHYYPQLPTLTKFKTGQGSKKRLIDVHAAYEALGPDKSAAVLAFHAFMGCDQTSKFSGKSKLACWKIFIQSDNNIIEAFQQLGENDGDVNIKVIKHLEKYVIKLFCTSNINATLAEARWYLFSKYQDCDRLPPTAAALKFKVLWTHLICLIWKTSHWQHPRSPDPAQYGWEKKSDILMPVLTDRPPAPEAIIEMSLCKCKTGCNTMTCKCNKNGLVCTEMCLCNRCENEEQESNPTWDEDDELDDSDGDNEDDQGY